ncbi:MAG: agmatine deiminase family protein [Eggerthellales bacterium]|nr:agmatine deiminase family protein [Eggerthellales bacterium]
MDISKFRYPGEFEPQSDVFINWLPGEGVYGDGARQVLTDVIKALLGHVNVHVNCPCGITIEEAKATLSAAGLDVTDPVVDGVRNVSVENQDKFSPYIRFHSFDDWSVSIRDNGPNIMVDDQGHFLGVNPNWSNYSNNDKHEDAQQVSRRAGVHMAVELGVYDFISSDMVSEGGNREFNGKGVLIAVQDTECRKRNPEYTVEEIEAEYKRIWNLEKIIWIPQPLWEDDQVLNGPMDTLEDGTLVWPSSFAAHADEYCRFVSEDTIILAEVTDEEAAENPINAENKRRIDAAYEILKNETLPDGRPLNIIRIPSPAHKYVRADQNDPMVQGWKQFFDENGGKAWDGTPWPEGDWCQLVACSYGNFLVCNDVVVGQRYWHEGDDPVVKEKDEQAKAVLQKCFPDREVIMVDSYYLNLYGGGVHCWTKNVLV